MIIEILLTVVTTTVVVIIIDKLRRRPWVGGICEKYVFITGCDTGFGNALARKLDGLGVPVFAGCLTEDGAAGLASGCSSRLTAVEIDVTKPDSVARAVETVKRGLPSERSLWGLVNNAGVATNGCWDMIKPGDWQHTYSVNVFGVADTTYQFLPLLKKAKGRIVNISSLAGRISYADGPIYCSSKFAVEGISDSLRRDMAPWGVTVCMLEPWFYATGIVAPDHAADMLEERWKVMPQHRKDEYGEEWHTSDVKRTKDYIAGETLPDIYEVVDTYIEALFSQCPKTRYMVGKPTRMAVYMSMLPDFITDRLFARIDHVKPQGQK